MSKSLEKKSRYVQDFLYPFQGIKAETESKRRIGLTNVEASQGCVGRGGDDCQNAANDASSFVLMVLMIFDARS